MYNRYIRNDQGGYSRIPVEEEGPFHAQPEGFSGGSPSGTGQQAPFSFGGEHRESNEHNGPGFQGGREGETHHRHGPETGHHDEGASGSGRDGFGISAFLRKILDKFHLENVDTGDVILLLLLFFLFKEDADEELLIALGLMLIL